MLFGRCWYNVDDEWKKKDQFCDVINIVEFEYSSYNCRINWKIYYSYYSQNLISLSLESRKHYLLTLK